MSSSGSPKEKSSMNVDNPYMNELKMHPKELSLKDGKVQVEDIRGPKGESSLEARMKRLEQEVFRYKKMAEREVDIIHKINAELIGEHRKEVANLWDDIFSLHETTNKILETKSSFVDGEPLPWKFDDEKDSPPSME
ncbi:uncharacterized protein [Lolium perenne]|uniref:uncharacterized protein n=1 Tax=Lolium perenne TaxID=4522 RepID=UPI0021F61266|nr:uncharacterized protein LOC127303753 [Lolium perenne]